MHIDMFVVKKNTKILLNLLWFFYIVKLKLSFITCPSFKLEFYLQIKLSVSILLFGIRRVC